MKRKSCLTRKSSACRRNIAPLLLCYFEGRTREEAAKQLGWTASKVEGMLHLGRKRLRFRLIRRGVTLSSAAATVPNGIGLSAAVPPTLAAATVQAALNVVSGQKLTACGVSAGVAALAKGALNMGAKKTLLILALTLSTGIIAIGASIWERTDPRLSVHSATVKPMQIDIGKQREVEKLKRGIDGSAAGQPGKTDLDKIKSSWYEFETKEPSARGMKITFGNGKATFSHAETNDPKYSDEIAFKLDPSKNPKEIHFMRSKSNDQSLNAIYALDGDTLKICFPRRGDHTPTEFKDEEGHFVVIFKRQPPPDWSKRIGFGARRVSSNNLKQIALAMHAYHDVHGTFPAAALCDKKGKPLLSWRVAILPYIGQQALYQEFKLGEPWDSEHNKKLIPRMPPLYVILAAPKKPGETSYRVFVGNGAAFEWNKGVAITDITDGTASTLLCIEARESVPWTKPDELVYDPKKPLPELPNFYGNGFSMAVFCDGSVHSLRNNVQEKTWRALITRDGGEIIDEDFDYRFGQAKGE